MAINFTFGRNKTINITIKDHAIRFVELKQTQPAVVQRMGERYLPAGLIKEGTSQRKSKLISNTI